uniref:Uncharacterized protein n=1 Tax=Oryza rufipogon TaxID=4529 RepID=A0A0E0MU79_ORYRU
MMVERVEDVFSEIFRSDADVEDDDPNIFLTDNISLLSEIDKSVIASGRHGFGLSFGHPVAVLKGTY